MCFIIHSILIQKTLTADSAKPNFQKFQTAHNVHKPEILNTLFNVFNYYSMSKLSINFKKTSYMML